MRTGKHFENGSNRGDGKIAAFLGGSSHGFGAKSAKAAGISVYQHPISPGLTTSQLEEHNRLNLSCIKIDEGGESEKE